MRLVMQRTLALGLSALALPLVLSCASSPNDSGSEKSLFASSGSGAGFRLPAFEEKTLENGLRILYVHDEKLPYISYSFLFKGGASLDTSEQSGLAAMVSELLDKGTSKRSAPQISKDLGLMGAEFDSGATLDYAYVNASALSTQAEPLLSTVAEVVLEPSFPAEEIERIRKQAIASLERRIDHADSFASSAWAEYLYETHPYARNVGGKIQGVKSIKKKNIIQFYLRNYRPNNAILAVTGKFTPELKAKVEAAFSGWEKRDVPQPQFTQAQAPKGIQIRVVDKPDLVQSQIRIGHLGIKRSSDDFLKLRVANTILGGAFASRLVDRVRKQLGLTYSISSGFDARQDVGPFEIGTFTKNNSVGVTIQETLKVVAEFKEKGINKEELERAKGYLKGVFPTAIETPEKLASNLMILRLYGIPDSYLSNYLRDIERISVSDVNEAIKKHIDPQNVRIVVYTNAFEAVPQLEPLGKVEVKKALDLK